MADDVDNEEVEEEEEATIQPLGGRLGFKKRRNVQSSPSPTLKSSRKNQRNQRSTPTGSSGSSANTCTEQGSAGSKMQAEQGSIGDLQKYHNRYLRNRRHTLANVR